MTIQTVNPVNEQVIAHYTCLHEEEINNRLNLGHQAYLSWKLSEFLERKTITNNLAHILQEQKDSLARLMTLEMGKPIEQAKAEIDKCARLCEHYIVHAEQYLATYYVQTEMKIAKVSYLPLGIILGIMPWNFPFWQVFRFAIPNVMAGNAVVLKHAPISSGTGNEIESLFKQAGFPQYLFQHLIVDNDGATKIIEHPSVAGVSLTGSGRAGSSVAAQAGKNLKKSVLELGGIDPCLVLEDADLEKAAQSIVTSRLNNAGQVCIASKRIIVVKSIEQKLIDLISAKMSTYTMGDPLDPAVKLGPMARKDLRDTLHSQVEKSVKQGAKLIGGGIIPKGAGFYYPPTLLVNVTPGMVAFDEELFGPVITICSAVDEQDAIALANTSTYGLSAVVFTKDLERGERIATYEINAGACFVNSSVFSDPRLPFGGTKQSGYGRELAKEGILEFVNTKTIVISD